MPEEPPDKLTNNIFSLDGPAKLFFTPMTTSPSQKINLSTTAMGNMDHLYLLSDPFYRC
jgi:hypothetical protein